MELITNETVRIVLAYCFGIGGLLLFCALIYVVYQWFAD